MADHTPPDAGDDWMTIDEIATCFKVTREWVVERMMRGSLKSHLHYRWGERKSKRRWAEEFFSGGGWVPMVHRDGWSQSGCVYFIQAQDGGPIKIGAADRPEERMRDMQCGNPAPLVLLATMPGRGNEKRLHERFARGRVRGEWFRADTPGLQEFIASL